MCETGVLSGGRREGGRAAPGRQPAANPVHGERQVGYVGPGDADQHDDGGFRQLHEGLEPGAQCGQGPLSAGQQQGEPRVATAWAANMAPSMTADGAGMVWPIIPGARPAAVLSGMAAGARDGNLTGIQPTPTVR